MATSDPERDAQPRATGVRAARSKAERHAARVAVAAYHEAELGRLIERVRDGIARYDAGEIDAFELDHLIHRYKRATQKLWSFCTGSGGQVEMAARTLEWLREQGELPNWWEEATPRALSPLSAQASRGRSSDIASSSPPWGQLVRRLGDHPPCV